MIPHNRPTYDSQEFEAAYLAVSDMGDGELGYVQAFEEALAAFYGVKHCVCVGSGLGALRLACIHFLDDIVRIPAYSCVALPNAILAAEAQPAPKDEPPYDISVNLFGVPEDPGFVEDLSHGGLTLRGEVGVMSFGPTKLLAAGAGGAILSNRDLSEIREARDYRDKPRSWFKLNDTMSEVHAAIGLVQLAKLRDMVDQRLAIQTRYSRALGVGASSATGYRYVMSVKGLEIFQEYMRTEGVEVRRPVELWARGFDGAENLYRHNISLPCYPSLTTEEQETVIQAIGACL